MQIGWNWGEDWLGAKIFPGLEKGVGEKPAPEMSRRLDH